MSKRICALIICLSLTVLTFSGCRSIIKGLINRENAETDATMAENTNTDENATETTVAPGEETFTNTTEIPTEPTEAPTETPTAPPTEPPTEPPTPAPTEPPTEPTTQPPVKPTPAPMSWKQEYLDYIMQLSSRDMCEYRLVYIDSDEIPELFISGDCEATGSIVCSYQNGDLISQKFYRRGGCMYIPKSGLVYNYNGNMEYYSSEIYKLANGKFTQLFFGEKNAEVRQVVLENGKTSYELGFIYSMKDKNGNTITVTEEEYTAAEKSFFDFSKADGLESGAMISYDQMVKKLQA